MHISIIMPAYNAQEHLADAIESVRAQSYQDWDLIVIDDGSSDATMEIARGFAQEDSRVSVESNPVNRGVTYTRGRGYELAVGPWIAFLDSDDMWKRDKLDAQVRLAQLSESISFLFTGTAYMNDAGMISEFTLRPPTCIDFKELLGSNPITCSSVMIRKDILRPDETSHDGMHEDYAMWLSVLKAGTNAYAVPEPLTIHRMVSGSKSSNKLQAARMNYLTLRHVGTKRFTALIKMFEYAVRNFKKYSSIYKGFDRE